MEHLYAHKRSTFTFWNELMERPDYRQEEFVEAAVQWLGIYEDQIQDVTPAGAKYVIDDWYQLWLIARSGIYL